MSKYWVIVADSSKAKIFARENMHAPLQKIVELDHPRSRMEMKDLVSDRRPQTYRGKGEAHHPVETKDDPKHHEALIFAKEVAHRVETAYKNGELNALELIAAPAFLGMLRDNIDDSLLQHIVRSIDKNLVHLNDKDLYSALEEQYSH